MAKEQARSCAVQTAQGPIEIAFQVQRRKGMRHLRVVVDESNQVVLKVPFRVTERHAVEFLQSQGEWVVKVMRSAPPVIALEDYLQDHPYLSAQGRVVSLELRHHCRRGSYEWDVESGLCQLTLDSRQAAEPQVVEGLRAFAREVLPRRVHEIATRLGLKVHRVTVRDQRTRWGSCSASRSISLNWRLILLPPDLHDYIILHELAHLTHLNHSKRYWALLQRYDPQSVRHDKEITFHSRLLMRLGRLK